jgi:hypothetical protein
MDDISDVRRIACPTSLKTWSKTQDGGHCTTCAEPIDQTAQTMKKRRRKKKKAQEKLIRTNSRVVDEMATIKRRSLV